MNPVLKLHLFILVASLIISAPFIWIDYMASKQKKKDDDL